MGTYVLKLYIAGGTPRGEEVVTGIGDICERELANDYQLVVIDVLERPLIAEKDRILATPTLVKELAPPLRRVIGDLSDKEQVLASLDLTRSGKDGGRQTSSGSQQTRTQ